MLTPVHLTAHRMGKGINPLRTLRSKVNVKQLLTSRLPEVDHHVNSKICVYIQYATHFCR